MPALFEWLQKPAMWQIMKWHGFLIAGSGWSLFLHLSSWKKPLRYYRIWVKRFGKLAVLSRANHIRL